MVRRFLFLACLGLASSSSAWAQRFQGGTGGGDAALALLLPMAIPLPYTFPNPSRAGEEVRLFNNGSNSKILIFSISGIEITNTRLANLTPGVYLLKTNLVWLRHTVY